MKLDSIVIRDAAARADIPAILQFFLAAYPHLGERLDRKWVIFNGSWMDPAEIRLKTPLGCLCWNGGSFYKDNLIYSVFGEHAIMYPLEFGLDIHSAPEITGSQLLRKHEAK